MKQKKRRGLEQFFDFRLLKEILKKNGFCLVSSSIKGTMQRWENSDKTTVYIWKKPSGKISEICKISSKGTGHAFILSDCNIWLVVYNKFMSDRGVLINKISI